MTNETQQLLDRIANLERRLADLESMPRTDDPLRELFVARPDVNSVWKERRFNGSAWEDWPDGRSASEGSDRINTNARDCAFLEVNEGGDMKYVNLTPNRIGVGQVVDYQIDTNNHTISFEVQLKNTYGGTTLDTDEPHVTFSLSQGQEPYPSNWIARTVVLALTATNNGDVNGLAYLLSPPTTFMFPVFLINDGGSHAANTTSSATYTYSVSPSVPFVSSSLTPMIRRLGAQTAATRGTLVWITAGSDGLGPQWLLWDCNEH